MAQGLETNLDPLPIGTDFAYSFHIKNEALDTSINITGYTLSWLLKRSLSDLDAAAVLTRTTGAGTISISGSFNATPASNTQRATVAIADTDTDSFTPAYYHWELKRTDAGYETRLAYGRVQLARGVHRT